jgi:hypothetical protein
MSTLAPNNRTVFPGILDTGSGPFKGKLTNTTHIIVGIPTPVRHAVKALNTDFETSVCRCSFCGRSIVLHVATRKWKLVTAAAVDDDGITPTLARSHGREKEREDGDFLDEWSL